MAIRDVEHESNDVCRLTLQIEEHAAHRLDPPYGAEVEDTIFGIHIAGLLRSFDRGFDVRPVFRMDQLLPRFVRPVVRPCWNSMHGFQVGRPTVLTFARGDSPLERHGACSLL